MRMSGAIDFWVTAALLALALAVGGAGVAHPLLQMLLGLGAIGAAAYFAFTDRSWQFDRLRRFALALLALIVALPLLQLIPLPPVLWHALPGRELPLQIDNALGWSMWRPRPTAECLRVESCSMGCLCTERSWRSEVGLRAR